MSSVVFTEGDVGACCAQPCGLVEVAWERDVRVVPTGEHEHVGAVSGGEVEGAVIDLDHRAAAPQPCRSGVFGRGVGEPRRRAGAL